MAGIEPTSPGAEVDAPTLARVLHCDERTVQALARKQLCVRAGRNRYSCLESVGNVVEHYRRQAAGHTSADGKADAMRSNAALKDAQRRLIDLKYAQLEGQLISIPEIEMLWSDLVTTTKWLFLSLPERARFDMPHMPAEDRATLQRLCETMLREAVIAGQPPLPARKRETADGSAD